MLPKDLILRCFGYRTARGTWIAICIDLALITEEDSFEEAKADLRSMIRSYLETVIAMKDSDAMAALLNRKAPLPDRLRYYWTRFLCMLRCPTDRISFQQALPIQLVAA